MPAEAQCASARFDDREGTAFSVEHVLPTPTGMPVLKKSALEAYLKTKFGPTTTLEAYGPIGKETSGARYKQYGYGAPIRLTFRVEGKTRRAVLGTMSPGPFGHEHPADRAQAMLSDYDCYGRLPRHIASLDVGAFTDDGELMSVAQAKEFFLLTEWSEGETYHKDLERLAGSDQADRAGSKTD